MSAEGAVFAPSLEGFAGPLDLLLNLVRESKFDLNSISVSTLAEQYIRFLQTVPPEHLQRAAEYLLMASWLAMLKSRLLLPPEQQDDAEEDPILMAERLALQMQKLSAMQQVAAKLGASSQLGVDFFASAGHGNLERLEHVHYTADIVGLMRSLRLLEERQSHQKARLKVAQLPVLSIDDARMFLSRLIDELQQWRPLKALLSDIPRGKMYVSAENTGLYNNSCLASTLMAALEMQREGEIEIRQESLGAALDIRRAQ